MISLTLFAIEGIFLFQAFNFEEELPEYDMDSEDEEWLKNFNKKKVTLRNHTELLKQDMHWLHDVDVFDTWCLSFPKFGLFDPALVVTIHLQGNFSIFCLMPFLLEGEIFLFSF